MELNKRKIKIVDVQNPSFTYNGYKYDVNAAYYTSYNGWLNELYRNDAKVVCLYSMHHQLQLNKDNTLISEHHQILHWVRYCIVEKYDENGDTLIRKVVQDSENNYVYHIRYEKE